MTKTGKYAPRQGAGRLAHPWFIHCPGLPLKRISESWVYVYHNPGLYSRMLQKAFPEPSILPPFWSLAEQPIKDSSLFGQSYLRKSEFQILKGGSHDEQKQSQKRGPLINETAWQLRGVAEIPKGKKKKKWTTGMLKSIFVPSLSKLDFLHGHQIQPRSSWPLQNSRTLFSCRMKAVIKVMNLFFHQITGVPVTDWRSVGEYSCTPITADYMTDTWLKHEQMNDRISRYLIIS